MSPAHQRRIESAEDSVQPPRPTRNTFNSPQNLSHSVMSGHRLGRQDVCEDRSLPSTTKIYPAHRRRTYSAEDSVQLPRIQRPATNTMKFPRTVTSPKDLNQSVKRSRRLGRQEVCEQRSLLSNTESHPAAHRRRMYSAENSVQLPQIQRPPTNTMKCPRTATSPQDLNQPVMRGRPLGNRRYVRREVLPSTIESQPVAHQRRMYSAVMETGQLPLVQQQSVNAMSFRTVNPQSVVRVRRLCRQEVCQENCQPGIRQGVCHNSDGARAERTFARVLSRRF